MKQNAKKICSLLVALCLLVGIVPFGTFATESSDNGVKFLYQQLVLCDDLTMNFEIAIDDAIAETAEINLTVDGEKTPYTVSKKDNGNYFISVDVAAAQMTDAITLAVTVDGEIIATKSYTILAYAQYILNGNYSAATKALVRALLNYGAKAQTYFKYKAGSLAEYDGGVVPAAMPTNTEKANKQGAVEGVTYWGSSMLFTGKLTVRYYFEALNGVSNITFTSNGNTYQPTKRNGLYYVDVAGINPQDIDDPVVLTVSDGSNSLSVGYGPMNYIARMYNGDSSEDFKSLLQALYDYHLASEAFLASGDTQEEIKELAIPEGATLICDYSQSITPNVPGHWGSGPAAAYANSHAEKDGRAGVLGFGSNSEAFMWYTGVGMDNMDLRNATHITFRMKVDSRIRNLNIKHDNIAEYNLYQHITEFDKWTEVTVPVANLNFADLSNASIQFQFATWNNGEVEYVLLDQVYVTCEELAIPEGATLICDYSQSITPNVPGHWGSGPAAAYANSHAEKDGRAGVLGFGSNSEAFMWYTGVGMDNMDLRNATHITFRMKVDSRIRNLNIKHDNIAEYNLYQHITEFDKWTEVTVPVANLNFADLSNASIQFQFATWNNGEVEYVLLDQVYVTCQELAIPEGATLICDYSDTFTPYIPDWGHGPAGAYYNSHDSKDGRLGVFGMGANGECFEWYTGVGMDGMNLTGATTITFRIKVDSRIRNLNIKHDNIAEYNLYQHISVFDQWTDVTVNIADLNFADLSNASIQFQFATWNNGEVEYVLFDQVYIQ